MKIPVIFAAFAAGCILLTGCSSSGNSGRMKKLAEKYVKEKYGFRAKAGRVSTDGVSWLTPVWEKSKAGLVEMTYEGKTFVVHANIELGADHCTDNYMEDEFCSRLSSYLEDTIVCEDMETVVAYTEGNYKHMVGKDVKSFDDLLNDEKIPFISVYMYTYGLDTGSTAAIDLSAAPGVTDFALHDWNDPSVVHSEYKPVSSPHMDALMHRYYAEWAADDSMTGENIPLTGYVQLREGYLNIAYEDTASIEISEYAGSPQSDRRGATPWYEIRNSGGKASVLIAFSGDAADYEKNMCYCEFAGSDDYPAYMGYNEHDEYIDKYFFINKTIDEGETLICRMVTEDK